MTPTQGQMARVFSLQDGGVLVLPADAPYWLLRNGESVPAPAAVPSEAKRAPKAAARPVRRAKAAAKAPPSDAPRKKSKWGEARALADDYFAKGLDTQEIVRLLSKQGHVVPYQTVYGWRSAAA